MAEDLNALRMTVGKIVKTPFQRSYQFRVEVEGQPEELDLFCKSVTYPMLEIDTDDIRIGPGAVVLPQKKNAEEIQATFLDHADRRVSVWLEEWGHSIFNEDGTVNMPADYVKTMKIFLLDNDGKETMDFEGHVFVTRVGEITRNRDEGGFIEIQATFVEAEV